MRGSSTFETSVVPRRFLFRFCDFFVRIWLANAFFRLSFPEAVTEKRFLAPLLDFILGIVDAVVAQEGDLYLLWRAGGETRDIQIYHYGRWDRTALVDPHNLGGIGQWAYLGLVEDDGGNVYSLGLNIGFKRPEMSRLQE